METLFNIWWVYSFYVIVMIIPQMIVGIGKMRFSMPYTLQGVFRSTDYPTWFRFIEVFTAICAVIYQVYYLTGISGIRPF